MTDLFEHADARELGHAAAERAAERAGSDWKDAAYAAFVDYARTHASFTTEDVRLAYPDLPPPPDPRAWGSIAQRAKRDAIIIAGEWRAAKDRNVHGRVIMAWRSLVTR